MDFPQNHYIESYKIICARKAIIVIRQSKTSSAQAGNRKMNLFFKDLTLLAIQRFILISFGIIFKSFYLRKENKYHSPKKFISAQEFSKTNFVHISGEFISKIFLMIN